MKFTSTRSSKGEYGFLEVIRQGLALDGGLFLPVEFPNVADQLEEWKNLEYTDLAIRIFPYFTGKDIPEGELRKILEKSYSTFRHPGVTPLVKVGKHYCLELFHGPTFSFKDVALQTLGNLFEYAGQDDACHTFLGATSGDTGSAAIHGVRGKSNSEIFILFPEGRVSAIQEKQMTTVLDENVHCLALEGDFDDCQNIVKEIFSRIDLKEQWQLTAVNSINFARVLAQIVYYFHGYFQWLDLSGKPLGSPLNCSVPTGNFGDIFAGYIARCMGLPLDELIIATNDNDILHRFAQEGRYEMREVIPTISPSMDIQISSNFERLLYLLLDRDSEALLKIMSELKANSKFEVAPKVLKKFKSVFNSARVNQEECLKTIREIDEKCNYLLDPHSAVGYRAADFARNENEVMCLLTAHPGKFLPSVEKAVGRTCNLPVELESLVKREGRKEILPAEASAVIQRMRELLNS